MTQWHTVYTQLLPPLVNIGDKGKGRDRALPLHKGRDHPGRTSHDDIVPRQSSNFHYGNPRGTPKGLTTLVCRQHEIDQEIPHILNQLDNIMVRGPPGGTSWILLRVSWYYPRQTLRGQRVSSREMGSP